MSYTTDAGIRVYEKYDDFPFRRPRSTALLGPIRKATFHHGGPVGGYRDTFDEAVATWRGWQNFHMDTNGWSDIGYHFGIDARGRLYQGRDDDNLGAHVGGWNTGNIGFNFMQDGRFYELTDLQKETVKALFDAGIPRLDIPPLKTLVRNPDSRYGVYTHQELPNQATACPGDLIQRHIAWRRGTYV
jgi:N-acetylmuramoyl-L-alanine amidase